MHLSGDDFTPISSSLPPIPSPGRKAQTDLDDGAISKKTLEITHHTHFVDILRKVNSVLHPSGCIKMFQMKVFLTATNVSKYGGFSGPYFPVFRSEKTPYLCTFQAVPVPHFSVFGMNTKVCERFGTSCS